MISLNAFVIIRLREAYTFVELIECLASKVIERISYSCEQLL